MNKVLKGGIYLAINTQDHLNKLAELTKCFEIDHIVIDEDYVAYVDSQDAIQVESLRHFKEDNPHIANIKPQNFNPWYRKNKDK